MRKVAVVGLRHQDLDIEREVLAGMDVDLVRLDAGRWQEAADADVLIVGSSPRLDREALGRLRGRAIVRAGIGLDSIDLAAARELGYTIAYVPDYGTEAVAFHTLALACAALRRLVAAHRMVLGGGWGFDALRPLHLPSSSTAGVVGLGRIGRRVAELFLAVGFGRVLGHDPWAEPPPGVESTELGELLARADVVTLHVPHTGEVLLGAAELGTMKEGSVLVNTARGGLVDPDALAEGLRRNRPGIAALDTFDREPPDLGAFAGLEDRLVLTPHMAWYTEETQALLRRRAAEEARRLLSGEAPLNPVELEEV